MIKIENFIIIFFLGIVIAIACVFSCDDNNSSDYAAIERRIKAIENIEPAGKSEVDALAEATMFAISHNHYRIDTLSQKSWNGNKLLQSELAILSNVHKSNHNALLDSIALLQRPEMATGGYILMTPVDSSTVPQIYSYCILGDYPESPLRAVKIWWNPNTESDLAGYKVYIEDMLAVHKKYIQIIVLNDTTPSYRIAGLRKDIKYKIKITAFDEAFNESGFSNEIVIEKEL